MKKIALLSIAILFATLVAPAIHVEADYTDPYQVVGFVYDGEGRTISGANVVVTDDSTNVSIETTTQSNGAYVVNFINKNYSDGDKLTVLAIWDTYSGDNYGYIDTGDSETRIDVIMYRRYSDIFKLTIEVVDENDEYLSCQISIDEEKPFSVYDGRTSRYLSDGAHTIKIEKDGYLTLEDTISVTKDTNVRYVLFAEEADEEEEEEADTEPLGIVGESLCFVFIILMFLLVILIAAFSKKKSRFRRRRKKRW